MAEEWKPVPKFPGYDVSSLGRIRSYRTSGKLLRKIPIILAMWIGPSGHVYAGLKKNGRNVNGQVGHWMLRAFIGPPKDWEECLHADDNPKNNVLSNLRWGTRLDNVRDRLKNGNHNFAKLSVDNVAKIKKCLRDGMQGKKIADKFGISEGIISNIKTGKIWKFVE